MTYVVGPACVDVTDRACVDECPVDCIYIGRRAAYINPDECIDCGACVPECAAEAIFPEDELPDKWADYAEINALWYRDRQAAREWVERIAPVAS